MGILRLKDTRFDFRPRRATLDPGCVIRIEGLQWRLGVTNPGPGDPVSSIYRASSMHTPSSCHPRALTVFVSLRHLVIGPTI